MEQITLTTNEWFVLKSIKSGRVSFFDGGFNAGSGTYGMCLAPELESKSDVSARGWGGVIASLVRKGLMETAQVEGNDTWLTLTQLAIDIWYDKNPEPSEETQHKSADRAGTEVSHYLPNDNVLRIMYFPSSVIYQLTDRHEGLYENITAEEAANLLSDKLTNLGRTLTAVAKEMR